MKFVKSKEREWTEKVGYSKKVFLNEQDLNFPGAIVQEVRIKPKEIASLHHHKKQTEIFYFLTSNGHFLVNGEEHTPEKGDVLVIEPNDKHEVVNDSDEEYRYIAFKINYEESDYYED